MYAYACMNGSINSAIGMCSVMWPTIAPSQDLPTITPVIDFGKTGGTRPSCNPPRTLYSRVLGSTGSSTVHAQWNPGKSAATRLRPRSYALPCKLSPPLEPFQVPSLVFQAPKDPIYFDRFSCSHTATQLSAPMAVVNL